MTTQTQRSEMTATQPRGSDGGRHPRSRVRRALVVVCLVVALLGVGGYGALRATSGVAATGTSECSDVPVSGVEAAVASVREAVCGVIEDLETAWGANDAEAYGAPFTVDATYTTFAGTHYVGRAEIIDSHAALFGSVLADSKLDNSYLSLRVVTEDVAILTTRGDTYEGEEPGTPTKLQTYTFAREGGGWSIAAFQNTQRQPVMERVQFLWMPKTRPAAEQ